MRALEIDQHMREVGTWVDWSQTVDTFKSGDPRMDVRGIAVAWQSQWPTLKAAHAAGCNLFVTHEPTFYVHRDDGPETLSDDQTAAKRAWLAEAGMVVYRCHDVWDVMPAHGIRDSWARGLGLEGPLLAKDERRWYGLFAVPRQTVHALAQDFAARLSAIGQDQVQVVGDFAHVVERLAIGTGAACRVPDMARLRDEGGRYPDALLVTDDGMSFWRDGSWALDRDLPLLVVNHATAEEWGMQSLAEYLKARFPGIPVRHFPQGCQYTSIRAVDE
ncbi:MAG: Nif3-like dinuclear metal center hexameric protein [Chloroflexota bacterium]|nr:Nif3-like dinuclear metal center hexameric protein [Chloroflexota bacterium]MDE2840171.1 Nif3-like dinuclear metal center hexameric protein [Chloroflexota bacterium]MDE2931258.1 Nif3-like dinuclear metal center hexameric protein [Chloroflexota bacterium]